MSSLGAIISAANKATPQELAGWRFDLSDYPPMLHSPGGVVYYLREIRYTTFVVTFARCDKLGEARWTPGSTPTAI
jgi:hypothetical protein